MKPEVYRPVMREGCTVRLVPQTHRIGALLPGILPGMPYRCISIVNNMIEILADQHGNTLKFALYYFEPTSNKYAMYEKVVVYNKPRNIYSCMMTVVGFNDKSYKLNNGLYYTVELLKPAGEALSPRQSLPHHCTPEQQTLFA